MTCTRRRWAYSCGDEQRTLVRTRQSTGPRWDYSCGDEQGTLVRTRQSTARAGTSTATSRDCLPVRRRRCGEMSVGAVQPTHLRDLQGINTHSIRSETGACQVQLTPHSTVLLKKLTVSHLVINLPTLYCGKANRLAHNSPPHVATLSQIKPYI
jgi:hypothetical protein